MIKWIETNTSNGIKRYEVGMDDPDELVRVNKVIKIVGYGHWNEKPCWIVYFERGNELSITNPSAVHTIPDEVDIFEGSGVAITPNEHTRHWDVRRKQKAKIKQKEQEYEKQYIAKYLEENAKNNNLDFLSNLSVKTIDKIKVFIETLTKPRTPFKIEYVVNPLKVPVQTSLPGRFDMDSGRCPYVVDLYSIRLNDWQEAEKLRKYDGWKYEGEFGWGTNLQATYKSYPLAVFLYKKKAYPRMESQPNENDKWILKTQLNSHHQWEFQTLEQFESICKDLKINLILKDEIL